MLALGLDLNNKENMETPDPTSKKKIKLPGRTSIEVTQSGPPRDSYLEEPLETPTQQTNRDYGGVCEQFNI